MKFRVTLAFIVLAVLLGVALWQAFCDEKPTALVSIVTSHHAAIIRDYLPDKANWHAFSQTSFSNAQALLGNDAFHNLSVLTYLSLYRGGIGSWGLHAIDFDFAKLRPNSFCFGKTISTYFEINSCCTNRG